MAKVYGYVVGLVFLVLGVIGFAWTGFEHWVAADTESHILWFQLNPTHNLAHMLLGTVLLWAGTESESTARVVVGGTGAAYLGLGIAGFWLTGAPDWNVLALNLADNVLHVTTGALALLAVIASPFLDLSILSEEAARG